VKSLSLVVAVYNNVRYLEFVLTALQRQSFSDFEVIVADDGSGEDIAKLLHRTRARVNFPIHHTWQHDEGFRKNAALNKAIEAATTDYLVFIDGDCIPHRHFLSDHWSEHRVGAFLCGRRVSFGKEWSSKITVEDVQLGRFERISLALLLDGLKGRSSYLESMIRVPSRAMRSIIPRNVPRIIGCNFSVSKSLLEQINGFNEDYHAPGVGEDSDIAYRLELAGARPVSLRYLAVLFHLYHPKTMEGPENLRLLEATVQRREAKCRNGLRKLSINTTTIAL
jgi:glycosyltransferase involved in cell wall biosynthesis